MTTAPATSLFADPSCFDNAPPSNTYETGVGGVMGEATAIGWSDDLGIFLLSGWTGPDGSHATQHVLQSSDAMTWIPAPDGTPYLGGSGRYLWIHDLGAWFPTDTWGGYRPYIGAGTQWRRTPLFSSLGHSGQGGFYAAWSGTRLVVGADINGIGGAGVAHSDNGQTWTEGNPGLAQGGLGGNSFIADIVWDPASGVFVACGSFAAFGGGKSIATSADGDAWAEQNGVVQSAVSLCWSPSLSRIVVSTGGNVYGTAFGYSDDGGVTWQASDPCEWDFVDGDPGAFSIDVTQIVWVTELDLFVAVGWAQPGADPWINMAHRNPSRHVVATSPDGAHWTPISTPMDGGKAWGIAWSLALGRLVVVGSTADATRAIMTSTDAATWALVSCPLDGRLGANVNYQAADTRSLCPTEGTRVPPTVSGAAPAPQPTSAFV